MLTMAELCAGYGGLHLAARHLWPDVRLSWVAETDPDAARVLATHYPNAANVGDITVADWSRAEPVDILAAGYPCQPYSLAGARRGHDDPRAIWSHVAAAVRDLRPGLVLLENVAAHAVRGFAEVVGDLAALGYDATWTCLRASDLGAPHHRDRLFVVATPADSGGEHVRIQPQSVGARDGAAVAGDAGPHVALTGLLPTPTASRAARRGQPSAVVAATRYGQGRRMLDDAVALLPTLTSSILLLPTPTATNSHGNGHNNRGEPLLPAIAADRAQWAQYGPAIARWEHITGRHAPHPTVVGKRGGRRLSARFVEWLMGLADGWVTSIVDNTAGLRLCGNGVVPLQAATGYRYLLDVTR